jgi:CBS domain-containing protein
VTMVTRELDSGGAVMQADQILESKGRLVESIRPEASVRAAVDALQAANVGALVVSPDGRALAGIVSERDVVRRLAADGADLLDAPVSSIMQTVVHTCTGVDSVDDLMHRMTEHRIRHLPVVDGEEVVGVISIGDVVKTQLLALETEREQLVDYIRTGR